ncbi:MAG: hypothetical protein KJZ86_25335 [Caldilineaceae bacterium]|nr:hypothetical protein [Caldilineaceae bacterium]HRJ44483.1 hypothetical protein [Caldilineaceae bacterium]
MEGIPAAILGRAFDPFYRAEASRNRETGVESEAGAGARFWFVLPHNG